ncbi:MAG: methyltransferase domain-containing protein [Burkholderiaceae bacterium]
MASGSPRGWPSATSRSASAEAKRASMSNTDFEAAKVLFLEGLAELKAGRHAQAEQRFMASLELLPGRISTLVNLAATRLALGRPHDSLATADAVLALEPENADALFHRANALAELGRHPEALTAFQTVCRIEPGQAQAWSQAGSMLRESGRLDEAAYAFEQAIAHGADPDLHRYYLAAVRGDGAPPSAPARYVQGLFDAYAGEFDAHLVQMLGYSAHRTVVELLPPSRSWRSALDLGCGTGLCGALLAERVERLVGVDLSAGMLEQARATGVYASLLQADLVEHLRATDERHDLVLAADVFIYVGALKPVFEQVARVLETGGLFCFSAECASDEARDIELGTSLRYAHSGRYLAALAQGHGFEVERIVEAPIREEQRRPIPGRFMRLRRS